MSIQPSESILIVDFGSQVTQLIARRVREAGVYSEIAPYTQAEAAFHRMKPKGIILSGSPASVPAEGSPRAPESEFLGLPITNFGTVRCAGVEFSAPIIVAESAPGGVACADSRGASAERGAAIVQRIVTAGAAMLAQLKAMP